MQRGGNCRFDLGQSSELSASLQVLNQSSSMFMSTVSSMQALEVGSIPLAESTAGQLILEEILVAGKACPAGIFCQLNALPEA